MQSYFIRNPIGRRADVEEQPNGHAQPNTDKSDVDASSPKNGARIMERFQRSCFAPPISYAIFGGAVLLIMILIGLCLVSFIIGRQKECNPITGSLMVVRNETGKESISHHADLGCEGSGPIKPHNNAKDDDNNQANKQQIIVNLTRQNAILAEANIQLRNRTREMEYAWEALKTNFKAKHWDSELLLLADQQKDEDGVKFLMQFGGKLNQEEEEEEEDDDTEPLFKLAASQDKDKAISVRIKYLIEHGGADVFAKDEDDLTFLHKLFSNGKKSFLTHPQFQDIALFLITKNLSSLFNIPGGHSEATPLLLAVHNMEINMTVLRLLHENAVNFSAADSDGDSLMKYAIWGDRSLKVLSHLVDLGVDWRELNKDAQNCLHLAASKENLEVVKFLIGLGMDVDAVSADNNAALHYAAGGCGINMTCLEIIKYLINHGGNAFAKTDPGNLTFLHIFFANQEEGRQVTPFQFHEMDSFLLREKNVSHLFSEHGGKRSLTPLMLAVYNVEVDNSTLELLNGSNVSFVEMDKDGDSILKYAVEGGRSLALLNNFISFGADWKLLNNYNFSLLHFSAYFGHIEGIKFFADLGLDVNAPDGHGTTPLHLVCFHGKKNVSDTVKFLLEKGANPRIKNKSGKTPLDDLKLNKKMSRVEKEEVARLFGAELEDSSVDPNPTDSIESSEEISSEEFLFSSETVLDSGEESDDDE